MRWIQISFVHQIFYDKLWMTVRFGAPYLHAKGGGFYTTSLILFT